MYSEFYKTTLRVYKLNKVINQYKKSWNPTALSSKANTINNIIKSLSISKKVNLIVLEIYPIPPSSSEPLRASVLVLTINRIFLTKLDPTSNIKRIDLYNNLA